MNDQLDPRRDCQQIMCSLVGYEFPFDYQRSLIDMVFLKVLAAPKIAGLLASNGYLAAFSQKRYDDTSLLVMEFIKHGYESPRGRAAIERMNQVHADFTIREEDYIYVLLGLMFEPIDWNARFGKRPMTETERLANYWFWRGVGELMGLTKIPDSYEEARQSKAKFEADECRHTRAGAELVIPFEGR